MKTNTIPAVSSKIDIHTWTRALLYGLFPLVFGRARLLGAVSPLGIAVLAGVPEPFLPSALLGSAIGALLSQPLPRALCSISSMLLFSAGRMLLRRGFHRHLRPLGVTLCIFTAAALPTGFYALSRAISSADLLLLCIDVLLASCFGYFFCVAGEALSAPRPIPLLHYPEQTSLGIVFTLFLASLAGLQPFSLNLGVIAGVIFIGIATSLFGIRGASVSGILCGIALNLYSTRMLETAAILLASAFLSGIFSPLKKAGQIPIFLATAVFSLFLLGAPIFLSYRIIDCFFGCAIFLLLPARWFSPLALGISSSAAAVEALLPSGISDKLTFAADTVLDLKSTLEDVSSRFLEIDTNNIDSIYDAAAENVCRGCTLSLECWEKNYNDTLRAFHPISDLLRVGVEISPENLPAYFRDHCCKSVKLCEAVNRYYAGFVARQNAKRQTAESRRIVFDQFHSISGLLTELSEEISAIAECDPERTDAVREAYCRREDAPESVHCYTDRFGRNLVEIYTTHSLHSTPESLCILLSEAAECEFALPQISKAGALSRISLCALPRYQTDWAVAQSCAAKNNVCGDCFEHFSDAQNEFFLLSDGMGHGRRAAIDSMLTCSVLGKLLQSGFGVPSALELLNSSLLVKSTDESTSTVDLLRLDLYTGKASLYKAGAALSLLCHAGEIRRFESPSLPVGILESARIREQEFSMRPGDVLLLLSDGATVAGEGFLCELLRKNEARSAEEITGRIRDAIAARAPDGLSDDVTVAAVKLTRGI